MKILYIPFYSGNPYQRNLASALRVYGVNTYFIKYVINQLFPILRAIIVNGKPDIIHLHWTDIYLLGNNKLISLAKSLHFILELIIVKLFGIKLVWTVHNLFNHEKKDPLIEKYFHRLLCMRFYDKIIVFSADGINVMMQTYQLPEYVKAKISVVPHGHYINNYRNKISKPEARQKLGISNRKVVFLYFGFIRPYKGILYLIKEFVKITDSEALLLIAGKPFSNFLEFELNKYSSEYKQIRAYLQFIPDHEIEIYMNAADVVVLPFQEILNSGSVVLAMSFAKAIISPNMGSLSEVMDKNGGFLYNPNDKSGLFNAMNQALKSDLISMGQKNYNKIKTFDWGKIARKVYEIYQ